MDQEGLSRLAGFDEALQRCPIELTGVYGQDAKSRIKAVRDELILKISERYCAER
jgi:hypothetical protein